MRAAMPAGSDQAAEVIALSLASADEKWQLLPFGAFDCRVEPKVRLEAVERQRVCGEEREQVVPLEDVPVPLVHRGAQQRRAFELVADESGSFRRHDEEADDVVTRRNAR